jgi:hypothetical protein
MGIPPNKCNGYTVYLSECPVHIGQNITKGVTDDNAGAFSVTP